MSEVFRLATGEEPQRFFDRVHRDSSTKGCPSATAPADLRQVIRMSRVIRLETEEEPEGFFDLEEENVASLQTYDRRRTASFS